MNKGLRVKRHSKIRKKIFGTTDRPRLSVFRSSKHIYAQIVDDTKSKTLVSSSDLKLNNGSKREKSFQVGRQLAKEALKHKIKSVVFDRGGFIYHGRVKELAKGLREGGLKF